MEHIQFANPRVATEFAGDQITEGRIAEREPAALRDAVCLILKLLRRQFVKVWKHARLEKFAVDFGHAIHGVTADHGQVRHAHEFSFRSFFDDARTTKERKVFAALLAEIADEFPVDFVNDLHVAREHLFEQIDRPFLERIHEHGVVGETENLRSDFPSLRVRKPMLIDEQAQQLRDGERRMRVVQLHRDLVRELVKRVMIHQVAANNVLDGGRHHEVLLFQAKLFALVRTIVRVEHG